jgi:hypothetical protein
MAFIPSCDISHYNAVIQGDSLTCGPGWYSSNTVRIFGSAEQYQITVTNATVTLLFENVSIIHNSPFVITNSTVTLLTTGNTNITSTLNPAISCSGRSRVTLAARGSSVVSLRSLGDAPGIGAGAGRVCGSIRFVNGSYVVTGEIGAGPGIDGNVTALEELIIDGGSFVVNGNSGAAIGAGYADRSGQSRVQKIRIDGGSFELNSQFGSGIGTGFATEKGVSTVGELVINGGTFRIGALDGAAIGAGPALGGSSVVENLTINQGVFSVAGNWGAGIGTSSANSGSSIVKNVLLVNGTFRVNGSRASAIGSAWVSTGESIVNNITILGGTFDLVGTNDGAGIGSGPGQSGRSAVERLAIKGGKITATGTNAGIGVGSVSWLNTSSVGTLIIGGANVATRGRYGFVATQVEFQNLSFDCGATARVCINGSATVLFSGAVVGTTNTDAFGQGNWKFANGATFYGQYSRGSVLEGLTGIPLLHVGNVSAQRDGGLLLSVEGQGYKRPVAFSGTGFILSLPAPGAYRVAVSRQDNKTSIGRLCVNGSDFTVSGSETLFADAGICSAGLSPEPTVSATTKASAHTMPTWMIVTVAIVMGACVIGLIVVIVCVAKKGRNDPDSLLMAPGTLGHGSNYHKR